MHELDSQVSLYNEDACSCVRICCDVFPAEDALLLFFRQHYSAREVQMVVAVASKSGIYPFHDVTKLLLLTSAWHDGRSTLGFLPMSSRWRRHGTIAPQQVETPTCSDSLAVGPVRSSASVEICRSLQNFEVAARFTKSSSKYEQLNGCPP